MNTSLHTAITMLNITKKHSDFFTISYNWAASDAFYTYNKETACIAQRRKRRISSVDRFRKLAMIINIWFRRKEESRDIVLHVSRGYHRHVRERRKRRNESVPESRSTVFRSPWSPGGRKKRKEGAKGSWMKETERSNHVKKRQRPWLKKSGSSGCKNWNLDRNRIEI